MIHAFFAWLAKTFIGVRVIALVTWIIKQAEYFWTKGEALIVWIFKHFETKEGKPSISKIVGLGLLILASITFFIDVKAILSVLWPFLLFGAGGIGLIVIGELKDK